MLVNNVSLEIDYTAAGLSAPEVTPYLTEYVLDNSAEFRKGKLRPAVLVCPGGGYHFTSDREAEPIALKFAAAGISAFVLRYSCGREDAVFPRQLCEAAAAMAYIRSHASEYCLDETRIAVCGFSAGGHLAASLGVFWNSDILKQRGLGGESCRPDAMILSYPVITGGKYAHRGSFNNLLGADAENAEMLELTSLERQVNPDTPPAFLWHTWTDPSVPVQNTLLFASALAEADIPAEVHIYPRGGHGLSLGSDLTNVPDQIYPELQEWIDRAAQFIISR